MANKQEVTTESHRQRALKQPIGETTNAASKVSLTKTAHSETAFSSINQRLDAIEAALNEVVCKLNSVLTFVKSEDDVKQAADLRVLVDKAVSGHVQKKLTHNNKHFVKETVLRYEREKALAPEAIDRLKDIVATAIATK